MATRGCSSSARTVVPQLGLRQGLPGASTRGVVAAFYRSIFATRPSAFNRKNRRIEKHNHDVESNKILNRSLGPKFSISSMGEQHQESRICFLASMLMFNTGTHTHIPPPRACFYLATIRAHYNICNESCSISELFGP